MLTISQIESLMAPPKSGKKKTPNAVVRTVVDGQATLERQVVKSSQFGKYEGKMGSKRRSAKGRISIMPNGFVYYNDVDSQSPVEVVAYKA